MEKILGICGACKKNIRSVSNYIKIVSETIPAYNGKIVCRNCYKTKI